MKLTAKEAVELSIDLWEWLAETGKEKEDWPEWKWNGGKYSHINSDCFLCEYADGGCAACPYGKCYDIGDPFERWDLSGKNQKKKYAKQFVKQLKEILKETK